MWVAASKAWKEAGAPTSEKPRSPRADRGGPPIQRWGTPGSTQSIS